MRASLLSSSEKLFLMKGPMSRTQIGDVKKETLPGLEALDVPGKKEGQVIMVKSPNGSVHAHTVSDTSSAQLPLRFSSCLPRLARAASGQTRRGHGPT